MNFDESTQATKDNFMNVARSYLRKLDIDNQEQDFKIAFDEKFKDIDKQASDLFEHYKKHNEQARKETIEYKKTITDRLDKNDSIVKNLNKSLDVMTKAILSLFFVVAIIALVTVITGPIGELVGVSNLYDGITYVIEKYDTAWRYLMFIVYFIPYVIFGLLIWGVLKSFDWLKYH